MEQESKTRIVSRIRLIKEELMEKCWHPDRLQRIISENTQVQWNYEEQLYVALDFNVMNEVF